MRKKELYITPTPLSDAIYFKVSAIDVSSAPTLKEGLRLRTVFVVSPYEGDSKNKKAVRQLCREIVDRGYVPFAAHILYPAFMGEDERDKGITYGFTWLERCDEVWIFVPRERPHLTDGMKAEVLEATRLHKSLRFFYYSESNL